MGVPLALKVEGKKFMWDGLRYETEDEALKKAEAYRAQGFEVKRSSNADGHLVYTRRVASVQAAE